VVLRSEPETAGDLLLTDAGRWPRNRSPVDFVDTLRGERSVRIGQTKLGRFQAGAVSGNQGKLVA